jgi:hypothetical protein
VQAVVCSKQLKKISGSESKWQLPALERDNVQIYRYIDRARSFILRCLTMRTVDRLHSVQWEHDSHKLEGIWKERSLPNRHTLLELN